MKKMSKHHSYSFPFQQIIIEACLTYLQSNIPNEILRHASLDETQRILRIIQHRQPPQQKGVADIPLATATSSSSLVNSTLGITTLNNEAERQIQWTDRLTMQQMQQLLYILNFLIHEITLHLDDQDDQMLTYMFQCRTKFSRLRAELRRILDQFRTLSSTNIQVARSAL